MNSIKNIRNFLSKSTRSRGRQRFNQHYEFLMAEVKKHRCALLNVIDKNRNVLHTSDSSRNLCDMVIKATPRNSVSAQSKHRYNCISDSNYDLNYNGRHL